MQSSYFDSFLTLRRLSKSSVRQTLVPIIVLLFVLCVGWIVFAAPSLTRITPFFGQPGDVVTITGSGFSTDPAQNIVRFGPLTERQFYQQAQRNWLFSFPTVNRSALLT